MEYPNGKPPFYRPQEEWNAARDWDDNMHRVYLYGYDRIVEWADKQIGMILDALDEQAYQRTPGDFQAITAIRSALIV